MIRLIAAIDRKRGLAKAGVMPWNIPEDEAFFTEQTKAFGGNVLSGGVTFRNTYKNGPLAKRQNFVLTRNPAPIEGVVVVNDLKKFLTEFKDELWVAGGSIVFDEVMTAGYADELYLTHIEADFGCDQFFPTYKDEFKLAEQSEEHEQNGFHFTYARYLKKA